MGHQSILMWIKIHYDQNTFTGLKFTNFAISNQKIWFGNIWKGKNNESSNGIRTSD